METNYYIITPQGRQKLHSCTSDAEAFERFESHWANQFKINWVAKRPKLKLVKETKEVLLTKKVVNSAE